MSHCHHETCCQCGAERGTIRHSQECADAAIQRAMHKARSNTSGRLIVPWPRALGTSLSCAAALCRAFEQGFRAGTDDVCESEGARPFYRDDWQPGCGKVAP